MNCWKGVPDVSARETILVVDDEADILEMLKYNLQKEGYAVLTAKNGKAALEEVKRSPNLVLLDVMMPEMDGWEVCRRIKREPKTASVPVLFLTAKGSEVDEVVGLELGADDYIVKPISVRKLLARVKAVLRRQETAKSEPAVANDIIRLDKLEINVPNYTVTVGTRERCAHAEGI